MFTCKNFNLTEEQYQKIKEWDNIKTGHKCKLKPCDWDDNYKYSGAIGGSLSVTFTPTSIGIFITVKCTCGATLELEDNF